MGVAGDESKGTHMACVMSGDMDRFVFCYEILLKGHILVASCVSAGVVAAGVDSINKKAITFPFKSLHRYTMYKGFSMCSRTGLLINRPFATPFVTTAKERHFGVVHCSIGMKSITGAQSIFSLISRLAMSL